MRLSTVFFVGSVALFASGMLEAKEHSGGHGRENSREAKHEKHRHQAERRQDRRHDRVHDRGHKRHGGHSTERANRSGHHGSHRQHEEHRRHSSHRVKRHHRRDDYFWSGLVVGGLVAHAFDGYDHDSHYYARRYDHGAVYWSNRHGECFSVERRHHRDVYIEVPRHRCY